MSKVQRAVDILGGPAQAARALNVTPQAVAFWLSGERTPSAETCIAIERATRGFVTVEDIRPDIDWKVVRRGEAAA
jgi:DNA-binding transcriptional regulator YdaS (Cro superfamily)